MAYLSAVTLLWAFSFSLIGVYLAGQVDSWFSVFMRVALASLVFIPFLKFRGVSKSLIAKLMTVGGFQLGLMYCFYYQSFLLLSVPEVLLFTVFTPIYVTLIYDFLKGRFSPWYLVTAAIAVFGAAWIKFAGINEDFLLGFLVVQGANLCFAIGQVGYKYIMESEPVDLPQHTVGAVTCIFCGVKEGVNSRQAIVQDVHNADHFEFTQVAVDRGFAKLHQTRVHPALQ